MTSTHQTLRTSTSNRPPLLTEVARQLKAHGGVIWLLQRLDYGSVIRAEIGKKQLRIIVPPLSGKIAIPDESNSLLCVVGDMTLFRAWLASIS